MIDDSIKWSGKTCEKCGFPIISDLVEVLWRKSEWKERTHKCEFIPPEILELLNLNSARKTAQKLANKYRVNSDDKIVMVVTPVLVNEFMNSIMDIDGIWRETRFEKWWNSGFPEFPRVTTDTRDHYQLVKLARDIVKEKLCTS